MILTVSGAVSPRQSCSRVSGGDPATKDQEAKDFYESAYKELGMKYFFANYAFSRRNAETIGMKFLFLHPTDLEIFDKMPVFGIPYGFFYRDPPLPPLAEFLNYVRGIYSGSDPDTIIPTL